MSMIENIPFHMSTYRVGSAKENRFNKSTNPDYFHKPIRAHYQILLYLTHCRIEKSLVVTPDVISRLSLPNMTFYITCRSAHFDRTKHSLISLLY